MEVSSDLRALDDISVRKVIADSVTAMAHRQPLPEPNGLVDADMRPIPDSAEEARQRVSETNSMADARDSAICAGLQGNKSSGATQTAGGAAALKIDTSRLPPQVAEN